MTPTKERSTALIPHDTIERIVARRNLALAKFGCRLPVT